MKIVQTGLQKWKNQHETFTESIKELLIVANEPDLDALEGYNDTTKGLQQLISRAINEKVPLRMLGAGWSWTKIATAQNGIMVDTKQLNTTFTVSPQSMAARYAGDISKVFFAQCGNGIWELSKELRAKNLSLKTSGASNGQTIVGAMSTGAHGSSVDVGGVQDYVLGMHIIVSPTRHIWLERTMPVVSDSFIAKLETERVNDDALFNAALVSFGSFGIIHGVLIETFPLFLLESYRTRMPYDASLKQLMQTLDFSQVNLPCGNERPFHFSVSLNPYDMDNGAYISAMYRRPYREDYTRPVANAAGIGPGDDAPCFIGRLTDVIPALVPGIVNKLLAGALTLFNKQFGTLGEIFSNTSLHGKLMSAAIGLPLAEVNRVTEILLALNKSHGPFTGLFAYRFIKRSEATLAFTRFNFTCILELDGIFSNTTLNFYKAVWARLDAERIPFTFHWGKMNELDPQRLDRMYGNDIQKWKDARSKLLDADCRKVFTNPLLTQWGLD